MKHTNRPGCLTASGLIAAGITLILVVGVSLLWGGVLFSPGQLNANSGTELNGVTSHADLSNQCKACHASPLSGVSMNQLCLGCHLDIQKQIADPASLHGVLGENQAVENCRNCHTEHAGTDGRITKADMTNFPHEVTGFSLTAHTKTDEGVGFGCQDCHLTGISNFDPVVCLDCHALLDASYMQDHSATFGSACLNCHDGLDRLGRNFDHASTGFPLTGSHASLMCEACHAGMTSLTALQATGQNCVDCHSGDDAHEGQFGSLCETCHSTNAWLPATFDHNTTNFPLTGAHTLAPCASCHMNNVFQGTPTTCVSCHLNDDAHAGQFGADCATCHATTAWQPASFDHNATNFPLLGAHTNVACQSCHSSGIYQGLPTTCASCHAEPAYHVGLFGLQCENCHSVEAWIPAAFNGAHTFPTNHGGANSCQSCHTNTLAGYTCFACHDQAEMLEEHNEEEIVVIDNCAACHPTGQKDDD